MDPDLGIKLSLSAKLVYPQTMFSMFKCLQNTPLLFRAQIYFLQFETNSFKSNEIYLHLACFFFYPLIL